MIAAALAEPQPNLVPLTWEFSKVLAIQYSCLLPLAFLIGRWHRRRPLKRYGLTTAGHPPHQLIAMGLLGFCLVALPFKVLWVIHQREPLGEGPILWTLLDKNWTASFWLFFAVVSFAVVPVIEELFFRGYCQTRLEEDWGGGSAVLIAALFFVFAHGQYHQASILSIATMACMVPMALGIGYVYLRSRSLLPCIVLHAALNFPTRGIYNILLPAAMLLALIVFWKSWIPAVRDFCRRITAIDAPATLCGVLAAIAVAVGLQRSPGVFMVVGPIALALALFMESRERRPAMRPDVYPAKS